MDEICRIMNEFRCEPDQTGISFEYGHASTVSKNVHGLCATGVFRLDRTIAGDRPPRYGSAEDIARRTVGRGPSHATRACERVSLAMPKVCRA